MADKKFITRNGLHTANVDFVFANTTYTHKIITYRSDSNTLSISSDTEQLVSFVDTNVGDIFTVNDVSGISSIKVKRDGDIILDELSSGNVGIRTSTPSYTLDVTGDINFTGSLYDNGVVFSGGGGLSASDHLIPTSNAVYSLGNTSFNWANVHFSGLLEANGSFGTSGQVLTSAGSGSPVYWADSQSPLIAGDGINITNDIIDAVAGNTTIFVDASGIHVNTAALPFSAQLNGLSDVSISGAQTNQVLKYNGSIWTNAADATGGGGGLSADDHLIPTSNAVYSLGNTEFNWANVHFSGLLEANGFFGTAGQVLTSGGVGANAYWSTVTASGGGSGAGGAWEYIDTVTLNAVSTDLPMVDGTEDAYMFICHGLSYNNATGHRATIVLDNDMAGTNYDYSQGQLQTDELTYNVSNKNSRTIVGLHLSTDLISARYGHSVCILYANAGDYVMMNSDTIRSDTNDPDSNQSRIVSVKKDSNTFSSAKITAFNGTTQGTDNLTGTVHIYKLNTSAGGGLSASDHLIPTSNAVYSLGNTSFNWANVHFSGLLEANGSFGTAGQVLTSGGVGANAYWSTVTASGGGSGAGGAWEYVKTIDLGTAMTHTFNLEPGVEAYKFITIDFATPTSGSTSNHLIAHCDSDTTAGYYAAGVVYTDTSGSRGTTNLNTASRGLSIAGYGNGNDGRHSSAECIFYNSSDRWVRTHVHALDVSQTPTTASENTFISAYSNNGATGPVSTLTFTTQYNNNTTISNHQPEGTLHIYKLNTSASGGGGGLSASDHLIPTSNAVYSLGNTEFNWANVHFSGLLEANGSFGTSGQVLTSAGPGANAYWSTVTGGGGLSASDHLIPTSNAVYSLGNTEFNWANVHFSGLLEANGSFGTSGQVLTSGGPGANAYWSSTIGNVTNSTGVWEYVETIDLGTAMTHTFNLEPGVQAYKFITIDFATPTSGSTYNHLIAHCDSDTTAGYYGAGRVYTTTGGTRGTVNLDAASRGLSIGGFGNGNDGRHSSAECIFYNSSDRWVRTHVHAVDVAQTPTTLTENVLISAYSNNGATGPVSTLTFTTQYENNTTISNHQPEGTLHIYKLKTTPSTGVFSGVRANFTVGQTFTGLQWNDITLDTVDYDTNDYFSTSGSTVLTIPETGYYSFNGYMISGTNGDYPFLRVLNTTQSDYIITKSSRAYTAGSGLNRTMSFSGTAYCHAGDEIKCQLRPNTNVTSGNGTEEGYISITRLDVNTTEDKKYEFIATSTTLKNKSKTLANTAIAQVAYTLPTGAEGEWVRIIDAFENASINNIVISPQSGEKIKNVVDATLTINVDGGGVELIYTAARGWIEAVF